ncbi:DUF4199 domain-containing protein [Sinomicrobium kalidii]|uniref:DUF4199 domain-containing protein n=1 Tax=Sinomicrobium kalidii TaxID=2900738 RepID=UPI001E3CA2A0|nr:DUF4199 domain-containing protein [Sinomicrobium kalidii]UGU15563.1 DUF4199 domain-containing protein [Sinomicrobium kalidii]
MEENQQPKTGKFALTYGLILGAISVVLGIILYSMDMHYQGGMSVLIVSIVIMLGCIIFGLVQFKKANNGYMSFAQGMKVGVGICLVGGIISMLYQLLLANVIDPDMASKQIELARAQMQDKGMNQEQIDAQLEMAKKFSSPLIQAAFGLIGSIFFGFVLSLIPVMALKKNNPENNY